MGAQLEPETVLKVFYQACQAVKHLHSQSMPITHRDIKVVLIWCMGYVNTRTCFNLTAFL